MLTYTLDNNKSLYISLYENLKKDILSNNIKANTKLPSKRSLAKQLHVSLITVENAYNQLMVEGYIYSIEKKGYFVEKIDTISKQSSNITIHKDSIEDDNIGYKTHFPFSTWSSLSRKVLSENISLKPTSFKGDYKLRCAIARHLYEFYSMEADPNCIVLGAGSEYLYSLLIQYFSKEKIYGLESPGHKTISRIYNSLNAKYKYINLDENGVSINELKNNNIDIAHVSIAHHFPTGITMPLKRRMELLKWANDNNSYIIEDDYDSEFRYTSKPITPLYQLDNSNRVIYMNTFSKTLDPAFRIAYMILPNTIEKDFENRLGFYHNTLSTLEQKVLARFIEEKYFERHISRMRKRYKDIHDILLKNISKIEGIKIIDSKAGLHFLIEHSINVSDDKIEKIIDNKYQIHTLSYYKDKYSITKQLVISYSNIDIDEIDEFISYIKDLIYKIERS